MLAKEKLHDSLVLRYPSTTQDSLPVDSNSYYGRNLSLSSVFTLQGLPATSV